MRCLDRTALGSVYPLAPASSVQLRFFTVGTLWFNAFFISKTTDNCCEDPNGQHVIANQRVKRFRCLEICTRHLDGEACFCRLTALFDGIWMASTARFECIKNNSPDGSTVSTYSKYIHISWSITLPIGIYVS